MEALFLLALIALAPFVWLFVQAVFYNGIAEADRLYDWFADTSMYNRETPYRKAEERRNRAWAEGEDDRWRRHMEGQNTEFQDWLDSLFGVRETADALDRELLEAMRQTPKLRKLVQQELPKAIKHCNRIHWLMGMTEGVMYFYEIANRPECYDARYRVIQLNSTAVAMLEKYPKLRDCPDLIQNLAVIRARIGPTCRNCPYLKRLTVRAPARCPSAELIGAEEEVANEEDPQDIR